jgi:hypothetical protein
VSLYGSSEFVEQPGTKRVWRQDSGWNTKRTWEGPLTGADSFVNNTLPAGYTEIEVVDDGELCTISAFYGTQAGTGSGGGVVADPIARVWRLLGNDLEKSLWEKPEVKAITASLTIAELAALRASVDAIIRGESYTEPTDSTLASLVSHLARGIEAYPCSQFVLRKTETVYRSTSIRPSYQNLNRLFSYSGLLTYEPTLASEDLIASADLVSLYWLKRSPTVEPSQRGQLEITQEYWGVESYDSWIYGTLVA